MPSALPLDPPQRLVRALEVHPDRDLATGWLDTLPGLLGRMLERWELTTERVVSPGGRSSLMVLVRQSDGTPAALKLAAPGASADQEAAALAHWNGWGAARLLRAEPGDGALLLERLHGEVSLRSLPEAKAMLEAASSVRRLWVAPPPAHPFLTVAERTAEEAGAMLRRAPEEMRPLAEQAVSLRAALLADSPEPFLLHGDFRQGAVLAGGAERAPWLAVGPEPLIGERAYDLARLARDRLHSLMATAGAPAATRRRINKLADSLEVDRDRLRDWTLYRAVASGLRHHSRGAHNDAELLLEFAGLL